MSRRFPRLPACLLTALPLLTIAGAGATGCAQDSAARLNTAPAPAAHTTGAGSRSLAAADSLGRTVFVRPAQAQAGSGPGYAGAGETPTP